VAELERKVGRQAMEIDFAAMLAACRGAAQAAGIDHARLVYAYLKKEMSLADTASAAAAVLDNGAQPSGVLSLAVDSRAAVLRQSMRNTRGPVAKPHFRPASRLGDL
jgi:hypothetical protein